MGIFPFKKKSKDKIEYSGVIKRDLVKEATAKKKTVIPVFKKIYAKFKSVLQVDRNYEYVEPPETLVTINKAYKVEGYFRRAVDRFVELIWKNRFEFNGSSKPAREYIQKRFSQISQVTDTPTEELFDTIAQHLVKYYNCFILKIRNEKASGGRKRTTFYGKELKPVAGYFIAEPTNMVARRDRENKRIKYWENFNDRGVVIGRYTTEDIIHITMNRQQNELFGQAAAINVLDDIRALRRMEENVEILVFQHAIPLIQYKVGNEEDGPMEGEVEDIQAEIDNMLVNGLLVTDGRHEIKAIGVRGDALDIDKYLDYFRSRIMVGLNHAPSSLGFGSEGTSSMNVINKMILDTAARFQRRIKSHVEQFMISELLEEGGFDSYDEKNKVELFIPQIDLDDRIRREFHISSLWQSNLLTEDEARISLGKDPMTQGEFAKTFFSKITLPKIEVQAQAQAEAAIAVAAAAPDSPATGEGKTIGAPGTTAAASNKEIPKNQFGAKRRSGEPKRGVDSIVGKDLMDHIENMENIFMGEIKSASIDINDALENDSLDPFTANMKMSKDIILQKTSEYLTTIYRDGFRGEYSQNIDEKTVIVDESTIRELQILNGSTIQNLFNDTIILLENQRNRESSMIFDAMNYKVQMLSAFITEKVYWTAKALYYKDLNEEQVNIIKDGILIDTINLTGDISISDIHPHSYIDVYNSMNKER